MVWWLGADTAAGSSAMPHLGQLAGESFSTPLHIGQTYLETLLLGSEV